MRVGWFFVFLLGLAGIADRLPPPHRVVQAVADIPAALYRYRAGELVPDWVLTSDGVVRFRIDVIVRRGVDVDVFPLRHNMPRYFYLQDTFDIEGASYIRGAPMTFRRYQLFPILRIIR